MTNGTDYAEWFEKLNPAEEIEAGDVVQIVKGKITKSSAKETGIFMVVTDSAGVIGNGGIVNGIPLAFIGQVRVKVSGKAIAGDYILPSGRGDGTDYLLASL